MGDHPKSVNVKTGLVPTPRLTVKKSPCQIRLKPGFSRGQSAGGLINTGYMGICRTTGSGCYGPNSRTGYPFGIER